ncbi:MAG: polyamine aminopropyltransferase [Rhodospirillales bacterium]
MNWFEEALHSRILANGYAQRFQVSRIVHRERTAFQDLLIFETPAFGRVLVLDEIVQTTERDEFVYHEMLAHVPLFAHGRARRVLIIGGGDGGVLREVLRHPVDRVTMVEIDGRVIDLCREHMPGLSAGAFDDPRAEVLVDDGIRFVAETTDGFDVIIVDSSDPVGPNEVLFTDAFYADCRRRLTAGGVVIAQSGVPFFQKDEVVGSYARLKPHFADVAFYVIAVPTYAGGLMSLGWATDDAAMRRLPESAIAERYAVAGLQTRYYSPAVHKAAFALPPFIAGLID